MRTPLPSRRKGFIKRAARPLAFFAFSIAVVGLLDSCRHETVLVAHLKEGNSQQEDTSAFRQRWRTELENFGNEPFTADIHLVIERDTTWSSFIHALDEIAVTGPGAIQTEWDGGSFLMELPLADGNRNHWQYEFPYQLRSDAEKNGDHLLVFGIQKGILSRHGEKIDLRQFHSDLIEAIHLGSRVAVSFELSEQDRRPAIEVLQYAAFAQKRGCRIRWMSDL